MNGRRPSGGLLGGVSTPVTTVILAVTVVTSVLAIFIPALARAGEFEALQGFPFGTGVTSEGTAEWQPWRVLTHTLIHASWWHLGMNMLTLWVFGQGVERTFGAWRFVLIYLTAAVGGALAVWALAPNSAVVGASGAIFGLMGASLVTLREQGESPATLVVFVALNFLVGFTMGGVSWQAHLGGLLFGLLAAAVLGAFRSLGSGARRTRRAPRGGIGPSPWS